MEALSTTLCDALSSRETFVTLRMRLIKFKLIVTLLSDRLVQTQVEGSYEEKCMYFNDTDRWVPEKQVEV